MDTSYSLKRCVSPLYATGCFMWQMRIYFKVQFYLCVDDDVCIDRFSKGPIHKNVLRSLLVWAIDTGWLLYMLLYILWESDLPGHSIIYMISASGRHVMEMAVLDRRDLLKRDTFSLDNGYPFLVDQRMYSRYLKTARIRLNTCGYAVCSSWVYILARFSRASVI